MKEPGWRKPQRPGCGWQNIGTIARYCRSEVVVVVVCRIDDSTSCQSTTNMQSPGIRPNKVHCLERNIFVTVAVILAVECCYLLEHRSISLLAEHKQTAISSARVINNSACLHALLAIVFAFFQMQMTSLR